MGASASQKEFHSHSSVWGESKPKTKLQFQVQTSIFDKQNFTWHDNPVKIPYDSNPGEECNLVPEYSSEPDTSSVIRKEQSAGAFLWAAIDSTDWMVVDASSR